MVTDGPTTADQSATAGKTFMSESLQKKNEICPDVNKAINTGWKWPFQDGTQNFGQT